MFPESGQLKSVKPRGEKYPPLSRSFLLTAKRLPGRLPVEEAAALLGFQKHDMNVLIGCGLLEPLGEPTPSATKWFWRKQIEALCDDFEFLNNATKAVSLRWKERNAKKRKRRPLGQAA